MDPLLMMDLVFLGVILIVATWIHFMPRLTRREIYFSVTVAGGYRETAEARKTIRDYRLAVWAHALIAAGFVAASRIENLAWLMIVGIYWLAGGCFLAFLKARHETLPHAELPVADREASVVPRPASIFDRWWLQAGPFAVLVAAAVYLQFHWDEIPGRFPIHWGLDGRPDGWSTRSLSAIYSPLLLGTLVCLGLAVLSCGVQHWTRQVQARGARAEQESFFRSSQRGIILVTEFFIAAAFTWTALLPLYHQPNAQMSGLVPLLVGSVLFTLFVVGFLVYTGQGGENLSPRNAPLAPSPAGAVGDRTPDQCWKAGVIYINRNDPAVLVEKRFGVGYTLNFGHPVSWVLLGSLLLIPAALAFCSTHLH